MKLTHPPEGRAPTISTAATDALLAEAARRGQLLNLFESLLTSGSTAKQAAKAVGVSTVTIWRWKKLLRESGLPGLAPRTGNCGRESILEKLGVTAAMLNTVKQLHVALGCNKEAWRSWGRSSLCPPRLARVLSGKRKIPSGLLEATKLRRINLTGFEGESFLVVVPAQTKAP